MNAVNNFMAIMFLAVFTLALTGCSKGDDPEPGPTPTPTPTYYDMGVLDKTTGLRFKSYKKYGNTRSVNYADNGRINNFMYVDRISYIFSYDPDQITYVLDGEQRISNVEYNEDGYLSHWSDSFSDLDDKDGKIKTYKENVSFSYSGGHLTNVTYKVTQGGEESWSTDITLTWSNNRLLAVVATGKEGDSTNTLTTTFTYGNNNYKNVYRQWTHSLAACVLDDYSFPIEIAFVGLIGPGSDMLPTSIVESSVDSSDPTRYTCDYGFNNDGSLSYAKSDGSPRYDFSYDYKK